MTRPSLFSISIVLLALSFSFAISESASAQTTLSDREISNLEDRVLRALTTKQYADMLRPLDQLRSAGVEISGEILFYEAKAYYHGPGDLLKTSDLLRVYLEDDTAKRREDAIALNERISPTIHLDLTTYQEALLSGDPTQIRAYRNRFNNPVMSEASFRLEQELMIEKARESSEIELYEEYLSVFPDGTFREEAVDAIDNLAFQSAEHENTVEAYRAYLLSHPHGSHTSEAFTTGMSLYRERISRLDQLKRDANRKYNIYLIAGALVAAGSATPFFLSVIELASLSDDSDYVMDPLPFVGLGLGVAAFIFTANRAIKFSDQSRRYDRQQRDLVARRDSFRSEFQGRADNGTYLSPVTAQIAPAYIPQNRSLGLTLSVSF